MELATALFLRKLYKGVIMYWDIHCHIDKIDKDKLEEAISLGIKIGAVSMDYRGAKKIIELKKKYPDNIEVFLGVHPEVSISNEEVDKVIELIYENKDILAGIGEVGIPYFYLENKSLEEKLTIKNRGALRMEKFVKIAAELSLPLNLHVVEDDLDIALPILEKHRIKGALFHWYEGNKDQLKRIEKAEHFISVSPWIFVEKHYLDFVQNIPLNMLLLESDGPCEYNGKIGNPKMIFQVAEALASLNNIESEELLKKIQKNTKGYLKREYI